MSHQHPLEWVKSLQPDFNDGTSFRIMRGIAECEIAILDRIRAEIVEAQDEATAVVEWDVPSTGDRARYVEAIALIDQRMISLGLTPESR